MNKRIKEYLEYMINDYIIGNESGPVCLGASLKKEVHSIYIPIHTPPESKIINRNTYYYKTLRTIQITASSMILLM